MPLLAVIHILPVVWDHYMAHGFTSLTFLVRAGFTSHRKYSVRHRWTLSEAQNSFASKSSIPESCVTSNAMITD